MEKTKAQLIFLFLLRWWEEKLIYYLLISTEIFKAWWSLAHLSLEYHLQAVRFMGNTNPEGAKKPQHCSAIYSIKPAQDAEHLRGLAQKNWVTFN